MEYRITKIRKRENAFDVYILTDGKEEEEIFSFEIDKLDDEMFWKNVIHGVLNDRERKMIALQERVKNIDEKFEEVKQKHLNKKFDSKTGEEIKEKEKN